MHGSYIGPDLFGRGGSVLVALEHARPQPLSDRALRERFGLSTQEVRIARLLARGESNTEIAEALSISPHTARTHTQRILSKLGIHARAGVASRVLEGGGA